MRKIFVVQCHAQNIFNIKLFPKYSISPKALNFLQIVSEHKIITIFTTLQGAYSLKCIQTTCEIITLYRNVNIGISGT